MSTSFDEQTALRIIRQLRQSEQSSVSRHLTRDKPQSFGTNDWWPCKSQASSDCPAFGIMAVVDMTTLSGDDRPIYLVDQPSTTFRRQYVIAGPDGVKANSYGACTFGPSIRFAYDSSGTPSLDDGWGPKAGQWTATKNYPSSISAIGVIDSTAKIATGQLSPINIVIGVLAGSLSQGSSATVNIYDGTGTIISSLTLTANDWLMKSGGTAIASGKHVICQWICGKWWITDAECP
jgi:hypothetical protein